MRLNAVGELRELIEKMNNHPEYISKKKDRVFQFDLKDEGTIQVVLRDGKANLYESQDEEADVTLQLSEKIS